MYINLKYKFAEHANPAFVKLYDNNKPKPCKQYFNNISYRTCIYAL